MGIALILIIVFRPQGILGKKKEAHFVPDNKRSGRPRPPDSRSAIRSPASRRSTRSSSPTTSPARFGGMTAVDVEHVEIPRGVDHGPDRPQRRRQDHVLQPADGFDKPNTGTWIFDGKNLAGVPAYKVSRMGMVRTFQLTKALGG